jgi:hypothetical protein
MSRTHAVLSPSSAERWLACTPSARLEEKFADGHSDYAAEGTLAHALAEILIRQKLKMPYSKKDLKEIRADDMYNDSMEDYCEDYSLFVIEHLEAARAHTPDAQIFLEELLVFDEWVKEGYGTGDVTIVADDLMDVIDFKYGKGVPVSALNTKQMRLYGLGAYARFGILYNIKTVRMTIAQPRIDNYSSDEISVKELLKWANGELKQKADLAWKGEGEFKAGNHCRFCRAKGSCKALADYNLELAKYDFADPNLLDDVAVADILNRADIFKKWIAAVEEYALDQAINHDKTWPGYKLVEGRSNRKYTDPEAVVSTLLKAGFAEDLIYQKKLYGITLMTKNLGKKQFENHLSHLLEKPDGKPTLVTLSDKRPEWKGIDKAIQDFTD